MCLDPKTQHTVAGLGMVVGCDTVAEEAGRLPGIWVRSYKGAYYKVASSPAFWDIEVWTGHLLEPFLTFVTGTGKVVFYILLRYLPFDFM